MREKNINNCVYRCIVTICVQNNGNWQTIKEMKVAGMKVNMLTAYKVVIKSP